MNDKTSASGPFGHSAFCTLVVVAAVLILLWIVLSGLVAVARNPYLLAVYWFLGLGGLVACAGACANAFPVKGEREGKPHPFRALTWLAAAVTVGVIFWSQGRPVVEGNGAGFAMIGIVLAMAAVIGIGGLLVLSAVILWQGGTGEEDEVLGAEPGLDLAQQGRLDLATEGKAA